MSCTIFFFHTNDLTKKKNYNVTIENEDPLHDRYANCMMILTRKYFNLPGRNLIM